MLYASKQTSNMSGRTTIEEIDGEWEIVENNGCTDHHRLIVSQNCNNIKDMHDARFEYAQLIMAGNFHSSHLARPEEYWFSEENRATLQTAADVVIGIGLIAQSTANWVKWF